jgi:hypothetical protein
LVVRATSSWSLDHLKPLDKTPPLSFIVTVCTYNRTLYSLFRTKCCVHYWDYTSPEERSIHSSEPNYVSTVEVMRLQHNALFTVLNWMLCPLLKLYSSSTALYSLFWTEWCVNYWSYTTPAQRSIHSFELNDVWTTEVIQLQHSALFTLLNWMMCELLRLYNSSTALYSLSWTEWCVHCWGYTTPAERSINCFELNILSTSEIIYSRMRREMILKVSLGLRRKTC